MQTNLFRLTLIVFCLSGHFVLAQNDLSKHPNQLFISPLRLVDPVNPGIEIGYQRAYGKNLATLVSIARMTDLITANLQSSNNDKPYANYSGWRLQAEEKYFLPTQNVNRPYVAVDMMYLKINYDSQASFAADTAITTPAYNDDFHIDKTNITLNLKFGIQLPVKHFIFDVVAGIGVKHRMVSRSGLTDPNAYEIKSREPNIWEITNKPGDNFNPNLVANIRVAYELLKQTVTAGKRYHFLPAIATYCPAVACTCLK